MKVCINNIPRISSFLCEAGLPQRRSIFHSLRHLPKAPRFRFSQNQSWIQLACTRSHLALFLLFLSKLPKKSSVKLYKFSSSFLQNEWLYIKLYGGTLLIHKFTLLFNTSMGIPVAAARSTEFQLQKILT